MLKGFLKKASWLHECAEIYTLSYGYMNACIFVCMNIQTWKTHSFDYMDLVA
jgi:hypothetical protein